MRQAVHLRHITDPEKLKALHSLLATHLLALPSDDAFRQTETMFHLLESDDIERSAMFLGNIQADSYRNNAIVVIIPRLLAHGSPNTRIPHLKRPKAPITACLTCAPQDVASWLANLLTLRHLDIPVLSGICSFLFNLDDAMTIADSHGARLWLLSVMRTPIEQLIDLHQADQFEHWLITNHLRVGEIYEHSGNLSKAETSYEGAERWMLPHLMVDKREQPWICDGLLYNLQLGKLFMLKGEFERAENTYHAALTGLLWNAQDAGITENEMVIYRLQIYRGRCELASVARTRDPSRYRTQSGYGGFGGLSYEIWRASNSESRMNPTVQRELALAQMTLGDAFRFGGMPMEALEAYEHAKMAAEALANSNPVNPNYIIDQATAVAKIAQLRMHEGALGEMKSGLESASSLLFEVLRMVPMNDRALFELGRVEELLGDYAYAFKSKQHGYDLYLSAWHHIRLSKKEYRHHPDRRVQAVRTLIRFLLAFASFGWRRMTILVLSLLLLLGSRHLLQMENSWRLLFVLNFVGGILLLQWFSLALYYRNPLELRIRLDPYEPEIDLAIRQLLSFPRRIVSCFTATWENLCDRVRSARASK